MLQRMGRRLQGEREGGFTLIELMVVVLIIAILIAIAIPTFLGARQRAQDRAAQSNLRNALTAEKTYYTDSQVYYATDGAAALKAIEPSLTFDATADAVPTQGSVGYALVGTAIVLSTESASGTCFYVKDTPTGTAAGTTYGTDSDGTCAKPSVASVALTKW
ncbi:MAG TPA: type II secretion system protein [Actinomycetes bacterium]|nr:type II secretion system protein [Actinomycetes bacterium]